MSKDIFSQKWISICCDANKKTLKSLCSDTQNSLPGWSSLICNYLALWLHHCLQLSCLCCRRQGDVCLLVGMTTLLAGLLGLSVWEASLPEWGLRTNRSPLTSVVLLSVKEVKGGPYKRGVSLQIVQQYCSRAQPTQASL